MIRFSKINRLPPLYTDELESRLRTLLEHGDIEGVTNALRGYLAPIVRLSFESLQGLEFYDRFRFVFLHNDQRWEETVCVFDSDIWKTETDGLRVAPNEHVDVLLYESTSGVFKLIETRQFEGIDLLQSKIFISFPKRDLVLTVRIVVDLPYS